MGEIVAVVNQKGGVGKTTTAVNLSACLSDTGQKILLVDVDPQGNATSGLGFNPDECDGSGFYALLSEERDDSSDGNGSETTNGNVSRETSFANLRLLPSSPDLAGAEVELATDMSRAEIRRCLVPLAKEFDFVLLDTPPSLGILTVNSLVAADWLLIPVQCEYYALEGLRHLMRTVELIRNSLNPGLRVLGLLRTMYDARTLLSQQVAQELEAHFPALVFETVVPRTVRLSEAPSHGQPIIQYDARSPGARAYRDVATEFLHRFGKGPPLAQVRDESREVKIERPFEHNRARSEVDESLPIVEPNTQASTEGDSSWRKEDLVEDWLL